MRMIQTNGDFFSSFFFHIHRKLFLAAPKKKILKNFFTFSSPAPPARLKVSIAIAGWKRKLIRGLYRHARTPSRFSPPNDDVMRLSNPPTTVDVKCKSKTHFEPFSSRVICVPPSLRSHHHEQNCSNFRRRKLRTTHSEMKKKREMIVN